MRGALLLAGGCVALLAGCPRPAPTPATATAQRARPPSHAARHHYLRALLQAEAGALDDAESSAALALRFDPGSPWIALGFGRYLTDLGAWERAEPYLRSAADAGVGGRAWEGLLEIYVSTDRPEDALQAIGAWAASAEPDPALLAIRGRYRLLLGDAPGAARDLGDTLRYDPEPERLDLWLEASAQSLLWRTALTELDALATGHPEATFLWRRLAEIAGHLGHEPLAVRGAEGWIAAGGGASAWAERGRIALRRGEAEQAARILPRLPGDTADRASIRAGLMALADDRDGALAALDAASAAWPDDVRLWLRKAQIAADAGDLEGAYAALHAAPGLSERSRLLLVSRARIAAGEVDAGLARLALAAADDPSLTPELAEALLEVGRPSEALEALDAVQPWPSWLRVQILEAAGAGADRVAAEVERLRAADPEHPDALAWDALARSEREPDAAAVLAEQALEIAPATIRAMEALARIAAARGDAGAARRWLDEGLSIAPDDAALEALAAALGG